jgi:3-oxoacyl-[acyl-carrier protein] reductase
MRQKAICDHEELLDSLYNRLPSSHLTYRPSLPSIAKEPIAPGPRVSYGVNLDVDSVVVRNKDGSLQRYPNQAYAHDSRIGQLYYLVSSGSLERVKALIDAGVNYRVRGDAGTTLLMHACENLRVSMVEYLLTLPDIEINAQDAMGYKALYFVINAGTNKDALAMRLEDSDMENIINTNLMGSLRVARRSVKSMIKNRKGRIIFIGSVVGLLGSPGQMVYASTKAGLIGAARSLAREVGSRGVTVNVVAPGYVDTDMTNDLDEARKDMITSSTPLGRTASASEIAGVVRFLASEDASYITGAVIPVDGGLGMGH